MSCLTLSCPAQPLGPELEARLLAARANAAIRAGDFEAAETHLQRAMRLSPWVIGAEHLFRLQLLRGEISQARQTLADYDERPGVEEVLSAVLDARTSGKKPDGEMLEIESTEPVGCLYFGLLHDSVGDQDKAREFLTRFLESQEWGRELASQALLRHGAPVCLMCRERDAEAYHEAFPVCAVCFSRLSDPGWNGRLIYAPDADSLRLMKNLTGQDFPKDLGETLNQIMPESLQSPAPLVPQTDLPELLSKLSPEARAVWDRARDLARERGREKVGTGELGMAIFETDRGPLTTNDEKSRQVALDEARAREAEGGLSEQVSDDLIWVLQQANWFHALSPKVSEQGIEVSHLAWAWDLSSPRPRNWRDVPLAGLLASKMGDQQVELFVELLRRHPDSLFLHLILSGDGLSRYSDTDRSRRLQSELWLIDHFPGLRFRSTLGTSALDPAAYRQQVDAWVRAVETHPKDADVLGSASNFFGLEEVPLAAALIDRCLELEPEERAWRMYADSLHERMDDDEAAGEESHRRAAQRLERLEKSLTTTSEAERGPALIDVAWAALEAGGYERAQEIAQELLEKHCREGDWNAGNAFHKAHTVLGLLALDQEDIEAAKSHLLDSGRTRGSPQLNSFGPNMRLAEALLYKEQRDVVLAYLEECKAFWKNPNLDLWIETVKGGRIPDFGANLEY